MLALLLGFTWGTSQTGLCSSEYVLAVLKERTKDGALNCFEFWFNRYQTLVAAALAFATAAVAVRPAVAQLAEMRKQSIQKSFDTLRVRGEEIEGTKEFFWQIQGRVYHAYGEMRSIIQFTEDGNISERKFNAFDQAVTALTDASDNLPSSIGPAWGDAQTREVRRELLRKLNNFAFDSSAARTQVRAVMRSGRMAYPIEEKRQDLQPSFDKLKQGLDEIRSIGSQFYQAIEKEESRVNTLLASLEPHVLT
ncbi:hypothetical protein GCM10008965_39560 [Methylorubrum aminovorans]